MLQMQTILKVADNTGAKTLGLFNIPGNSHQKSAAIGAVVVASVKTAIPDGTVKKGEVVKCVIVRTCNTIIRPDGTCIRFDDNAAVIIDKEGNPRGTRIFGPVARELRELGYMKIVSLAPEVL
ncbi:MAG: 50S ribosomal protein L14 [Christensenellaceae bacterium]|jgi:large subunit ribosomal protein L14|nr:50S ribosomal protein L14 [Christensenellaceae bacterium]